MASIGKVFLSHSSLDKSFVDQLASDLAKAGIPVWYDKLDISIGDSVPQKINEALTDAQYFLIVLSPDAMESRWVREELNAALVRQIACQGTFLLPVLLSDCDIPPLLAHRHYADFRCSYDAGLEALLSMWGKDRNASAMVGDKPLFAWPDTENEEPDFVYLHSQRFDKFFKMNCNRNWTANRTIDYVVSTLRLPWNKDIPELGMRWSFSYGLVHGEESIPLRTNLESAGIGTGDILKLSISGTYEDLWEQELKEMWSGGKMYEITSALRREAFLRQAIGDRTSLTRERLREIADSCFKHV